jgi:hypothetical protein
VVLPPLLLLGTELQTIERVQITTLTELDNGQATFRQDGRTAVPNKYLDELLFLNCSSKLATPTVAPDYPGKCPAFRDVSQMLPGTRTRIRIRTGDKPGLFVWHW